MQAAVAARPAPSGLVAGQYGTLTTGWANGDPRPTAEHPQLALVLVPHGSGTGRGAGSDGGTAQAADGGGSAEPQPWVFPFNKPLAPGEGDNQAMAVNTRDNTVSYDVAFALVWVNDDSPALNRNEAYAFASCSNCAAVSVGFQIVLVTGDNHVAAPQNISAAVNSDCVNCLSYALATQLFVTLDGPLSADGQSQIAALWKDIAAFGAHIASVPLSEIRSRLTAYEAQILAVIEKEQGPLAGDTATASPTPGAPTGSPTGTAAATAGTTPVPSGTASPTAPVDGSSPAATASGTPATDPSTASTDTAGSPSPTPTGSASPEATPVATATPTEGTTP